MNNIATPTASRGQRGPPRCTGNNGGAQGAPRASHMPPFASSGPPLGPQNSCKLFWIWCTVT